MRSSRVSTVLGWLGLALMALGLVIGLAVPVHANGTDCGTGFRHETNLFEDPACDSARDTPRLTAIVIIGLGLATGVAALATGWVEAKAEEANSGAAS